MGHLVHPTNYVFDYFSLKNKVCVNVKKPKLMSFKLFSENQFSSFEKFYLKNKLYISDSMEYETLGKDHDKTFYTDSTYEDQRIEDFYHLIRVREPVIDDNSKIQFREKAAKYEKEGVIKQNTSLTALFEYPKTFFRNTGYRSKNFYNVIGESYFNGRKINRKIIYNIDAKNYYNLSSFYLYNFLFATTKDRNA